MGGRRIRRSRSTTRNHAFLLSSTPPPVSWYLTSIGPWWISSYWLESIPSHQRFSFLLISSFSWCCRSPPTRSSDCRVPFTTVSFYAKNVFLVCVILFAITLLTLSKLSLLLMSFWSNSICIKWRVICCELLPHPRHVRMNWFVRNSKSFRQKSPNYLIQGNSFSKKTMPIKHKKE